MRHHENKRSKKANLSELKGSKTKLELKRYFFKQMDLIEGWQLFTIIAKKQYGINLNTSRPSPEIFYDTLLIKLLQAISMKKNATVIIDRSKSQKDIDALNARIEEAFFQSPTKFIINHDHSYTHAGLQSVDLFSWGIARKYEQNDTEWYNIFKKRIALELQT